jgi:hypothetical protein
MLSASEGAQRGKSELRLSNGERRSLEFQPAMPADRGPVELVRAHVCQQLEVVDEHAQRRRARLADGDLGLEEVAPLDRAGEASYSYTALMPALFTGSTIDRLASWSKVEA